MNLLEVLTSDVVQILQLPVTAIIVWIFSKRHFQKRDLKDRDTAIEKSQVDVIRDNLDLYQTMLTDVKLRYNEEIKEAYSKIDALEAIIVELKEANRLLDQKLYSLSNQLITIKGELKRHEKDNE